MALCIKHNKTNTPKQLNRALYSSAIRGYTCLPVTTIRISTQMKTKQIGLRLSEAEYDALYSAAIRNQTTVTGLVTKAALMVAERMGAPERNANPRSKTTTVQVGLYPADEEALVKYMERNDIPKKGSAVLAAARRGLIQAGFLTMPLGPDLQG